MHCTASTAPPAFCTSWSTADLFELPNPLGSVVVQEEVHDPIVTTVGLSFRPPPLISDRSNPEAMAEENRRISTTPIPVPVLFGGPQSAAPTPSPLSQAPVAAEGEGDAPAGPTDAPAPAEAPATVPASGDAPTVPASGDALTETPTEAPIEVPAEATSIDVTMTDVESAEKAAV